MKLERKREIKHFFIAVLVIALAFGFDDGSELFSAVSWITNFVVAFISVLFCYGLYLFAQKKMAEKHGVRLEYSLWFMEKFWFGEKKRKYGVKPKFYIGVVLSVVLTFISSGLFPFTGLGESKLIEKVAQRTGRKFKRVTDYETALIYLAGPFALTIFMLILSWLKIFGFEVGNLIFISVMIVLFNLVPIPSLDGSKIFFSSRVIYVFAFVGMILAYFLGFLGFFGAAILSIILAAIIAGVYHYKWEA
jgi:hypothetical protein